MSARAFASLPVHLRRATLLRLLGFLLPYGRWVALSVLLGVATVAAGIGLLGTSAYLIATAALHPSVAVLQVAIVGVRFFGILRGLMRYLERLVTHDANFRLLAGLRAWFYRQVEPLAPARLAGTRSADLLSRAVADIETLENFYVRAVAPPLVALVITAGVGLFIGRYDPRLGLLLVGALLVAGAGLPLLAHLLGRAAGQDLVERRSALNASLLDAIQGMPELLAFGQGPAQLEQIAASGRALGAAQYRIGQAGALANALNLLMSGLALWGLLLLAIPLVGTRIDGVLLAVLCLVALAAFEAVTPLAPAAQHLESSLAAARRLFALADSAAEIRRPAEDTHPPVVPPVLPDPPPPLDVRIRGLSFAYQPGDPPALLDFSLDLPPGKRVALLGPSGAGKSTLFNLLLRFWEPDAGQIELNGYDIRAYDPHDIRRCTALIRPDTYLFSGTLRQNILLARPGASAEDVQRAVERAQLSELAAQLPDGLDQWIGERGLQLSGGQRQRLALARALLRDAPLLLLDEPTAHLDAQSEQRLLPVLLQAAAGRSLIYITHRLAGLESMDEIVLLQAGRVAERGSHASLLAASGLYARWWAIERSYLAGTPQSPAS